MKKGNSALCIMILVMLTICGLSPLGASQVLAYELSTITPRIIYGFDNDGSFGDALVMGATGPTVQFRNGMGIGLSAALPIANSPIFLNVEHFRYDATLLVQDMGLNNKPGSDQEISVTRSLIRAERIVYKGIKIGLFGKSTDYPALVARNFDYVDFTSVTYAAMGISFGIAPRYTHPSGFFLQGSFGLDVGGAYPISIPSYFEDQKEWDVYAGIGLAADVGWEWDLVTWTTGFSIGGQASYETINQNDSESLDLFVNGDYKMDSAGFPKYSLSLQWFFRF